MIDPDLDEVRRLAIHVAAQVHARSHDGTPAADQRLTATADAITGWLLTDPAQVALETRIALLEARMTASETALQALDAATNEVADELDELRDLIASTDAATAARIQSAADRLRSLAQDPANPVPEPGPEPV